VDNLLKVMNTQKTGGYIFAAAHNIQDDVSPQAVVEMYDAARGFFSSGKGRKS
jgi:uroporphyrinogen-III decarboxylase